jgi:exosortase/archaeosortase family protein
LKNQPPDSSQSALIARPEAIRFLGWFLGLVAVYYILTAIPWVDRYVIYPVLEFSAGGASKMLNLVGYPTRVIGVIIQGPDFSVAVRRGCDPLEPIVLFTAAVLAFPGPWRPKLWGVAVGVVFFYSLNLVRILSLYLTGKSNPSWFDSLHQEWWPALFIFSAVLLWLAWLWRLRAFQRQAHA